MTAFTENTSADKEWPFSAARSAGSQCQELLSALLAVDTFDEISTIEDFDGVERYIKGQGAADSANKTTKGLVFWLYPTGLKGPYHDTDEGVIETHGALVTVERGVCVAEAVRRARAIFIDKGIVHKHISAVR